MSRVFPHFYLGFKIPLTIAGRILSICRSNINSTGYLAQPHPGDLCIIAVSFGPLGPLQLGRINSKLRQIVANQPPLRIKIGKSGVFPLCVLNLLQQQRDGAAIRPFDSQIAIASSPLLSEHLLTVESERKLTRKFSIERSKIDVPTSTWFHIEGSDDRYERFAQLVKSELCTDPLVLAPISVIDEIQGTSEIETHRILEVGTMQPDFRPQVSAAVPGSNYGIRKLSEKFEFIRIAEEHLALEMKEEFEIRQLCLYQAFGARNKRSPISIIETFGLH